MCELILISVSPLTCPSDNTEHDTSFGGGFPIGLPHQQYGELFRQHVHIVHVLSDGEVQWEKPQQAMYRAQCCQMGLKETD